MTAHTEDLNASSEGAQATLCGSEFHSTTVWGKKEVEKYNLEGVRSRGKKAWGAMAFV